MYCKFCGKSIDENSKFCNHCGKQIVLEEPKKSPNGKGKAISSMVLGIVAAVWSVIVLLSLIEVETEIYLLESFAEVFGFFIGLNLFSLPTGITGLVLGLVSKHKSGIKISGIILNSISLFIAFISLVTITIIYI